MGSTKVGASLPEDRNRTTFQNVVNLKTLDDGFSLKKNNVTVNFSHAVFSDVSTHDGRLRRVWFTVKQFCTVQFRVLNVNVRQPHTFKHHI